MITAAYGLMFPISSEFVKDAFNTYSERDYVTGFFTALFTEEKGYEGIKIVPFLIDRISLVYNRTKRAITFQYLTLDIYNEKLKSKVAGHPSFSSTKEVQEYYLKTNFYRSE